MCPTIGQRENVVQKSREWENARSVANPQETLRVIYTADRATGG